MVKIKEAGASGWFIGKGVDSEKIITLYLRTSDFLASPKKVTKKMRSKFPAPDFFSSFDIIAVNQLYFYGIQVKRHLSELEESELKISEVPNPNPEIFKYETWILDRKTWTVSCFVKSELIRKIELPNKPTNANPSKTVRISKKEKKHEESIDSIINSVSI